MKKSPGTWRATLEAIPRCGADLVGYFAPHEGSATTAYGIYHVKDLADYEAYRARLAAERGLRVRFPQRTDPVDWALSHAAFLGAQRLGGGTAFMLEAFRARFVRGANLGDAAIVSDAAERAGLDAPAVIAAAHDDDLRTEAAGNFDRAIERDRIFGVPTFIYRGDIFWGHDRMRFVRQAIEQAQTDLNNRP